MRSSILAAIVASLLVTACGDWKTGQANNAQANISNDARPAATANASAVTNSGQ